MTISSPQPQEVKVKVSETEASPDVSVIIVSYNVSGLLEECLQSCLAQSAEGISVEVIVVDNSSSDGSPFIVQKKFPYVKLIANEHNLGFPRACNQGLRAARGRYLFFLNPDAVLERDALQILVTFLEQQPRVGIAGPRLLYPDGRPQPNRRRFPNRRLALVESTFFNYRFPLKNWKELKRYTLEDRPDTERQPVDWLVGAAFMVRREVIDQIGGLDERFFMYLEEVDFFNRARGRGWESWYIPEAVVTHQEGQSSGQNVSRRYINFHTSKVSYYRKHFGPFFGEFLRLYLLGTHFLEFLEEGVKLGLRHKPALRRERLKMLKIVMKSGFKPYRTPHPHSLSELEVALVSAEFPPMAGGVGDYTACLAKAVAQNGIGKVRVITGGSSFGEPGVTGGENFQVNRLRAEKWDWKILGEIARFLNEKPVNVLAIQYQTGAYKMHPAINFLPLYLKWRMGAARPAVITTFHDLLFPYLFPKAGPLRSWVNRLLLNTSDRAIVTNRLDFYRAKKWETKPGRVKLVPIGSNITPVSREKDSSREETRKKWGLAKTDFALGYFGLLNRSKGVDLLLLALSRLRQTPGGQKWKLVIVGGETGQTDPTNRLYAREITKMIRELDLGGAVIQTGHLDTTATSQALYSLDLMVLPFRDGASFRRGSLLAALAHGLPVITTGKGPSKPGVLPPENTPFETLALEPEENLNGLISPLKGGPQLLNQQNVFLVEPGNLRELEEGLETLEANPSLRLELGKGALELSQYFSWDRISGDLIELILQEKV